MSKILVVGAGGRLGKAVVRLWRGPSGTVMGLDRAALPLGDLDGLRSVLAGYEFDTLVNCAALTNVDFCEGSREEAFRINAQAPGVMAQVCEEKGAQCIHISTDYVFDGLGRRPYRESDTPRPVSVYGESKLAGERAVLEAGACHRVVRVSWVFGPDRPSFVDQIVEKAMREKTVSAVCDKWATPTYTVDAVECLQALAEHGGQGGVVHLSNTGQCTWQEYGQWALDCAREGGVELSATTVDPVNMADLKAFVAVRPPYTVMDCERLFELCGMRLRSWRDAVREYVHLRFGGRGVAKAE